MSDLSNLLDSLSGRKEEIKTVYDNFSWMWEPRATITETPREGYPDGTVSAPTNSTIDKAADVVTMGTNFYTQLKGLFGLGYPANEVQPVSPIRQALTTDTTPGPAAMPGIAGMSAEKIAVIAGIAIVLLLLLKK